MKRNVLAVACALVSLAGCSDRGGGEVEEVDLASTDPPLMTGDSVFASPSVGLPSDIHVGPRRIWIADAAQEPSLHVLDRETGQLLASFGRQGDGPNEFRSRPALYRPPGSPSDTIWAWDYALSRLTRLSPDGLSGDPLIVQVDAPVGADRPWRLAWIGHEQIVGIHPSEEARFSVLSPTGALLGTTPGRFLGPEEARVGLRRQATMEGFNVCPWPDRGFAIIYFRVGRIEYYDRDGVFLRIADVPYPSDALVSDPDGTFRAVRGREYYRACVVHEDRLITAFSGRSSATHEGVERSASEFLHVFNWEGDLIEAYRLDPPIHAIDVASEGRLMFGASLIDATIYRYRFPE